MAKARAKYFSGRSVTACGAVVVVLLYVSLFFAAVRTQQVAPGDEDQVCAEAGSGSDLPDIDVNQEILMASYNYANLLEINGGPWISVVENNHGEPSVSSPGRCTEPGYITDLIAAHCMHVYQH